MCGELERATNWFSTGVVHNLKSNHNFIRRRSKTVKESETSLIDELSDADYRLLDKLRSVY